MLLNRTIVKIMITPFRNWVWNIILRLAFCPGTEQPAPALRVALQKDDMLIKLSVNLEMSRFRHRKRDISLEYVECLSIG